MELVNTRTVAEHLCTLATVLEAEALRARALGLRPHRNFSMEAFQLRALAEKLWQKNMMIELPSATEAPSSTLPSWHPAQPNKRRARHPATNSIPPAVHRDSEHSPFK